jgi:small-conductance mechanosensitive channel
MEGFLDKVNEVLNANSLQSWLAALGILAATLIILGVLLRWGVRRLAKSALATQHDVDDFLADFLNRTRWYFIVVGGIYAASLALIIPEPWQAALRTILLVATLLQAGLWGITVINYVVRRKVTVSLDGGTADATTLNALGLVVKIVMWSVLTLLILENITGIRVDTLIASLGIGGIAVALAVQNILGDLFSALTIALDKPFVIGDTITVGEFTGTVEHVGLKSTRVRSLTGEQLVFSNSDLLGSRIRNYKRMQRRRVVFTIGVTYQTPHTQLQEIPAMLRAIIEGRENVTFDRAHLRDFSPASINFEVVYFMEIPDYLPFMDVQQSINLDIFQRFDEAGIVFANPLQTIVINPSRP